MSLYRRRRRRPEINVVPLVDVMTVLIFFFLMTMHFEDMRALAITPPAAESAGRESEGRGAVVAVTREGKFFLNGEEIAKEKLLEWMRQEGAEEKGKTVLIVADEETVTKDTVFLLDQASQAHLTPRLVTRPAGQ